jgi:hypothetical protein
MDGWIDGQSVVTNRRLKGVGSGLGHKSVDQSPRLVLSASRPCHYCQSVHFWLVDFIDEKRKKRRGPTQPHPESKRTRTLLRFLPPLLQLGMICPADEVRNIITTTAGFY